MNESNLHSGYNRSNSNNVEFIPLKEPDCSLPTGDGQTPRPESRLRNRSANSPLPAVPLPEKKSRVSNRTHASCDDISRLTPNRNNSTCQQLSGQLARASSMDFDTFHRSTSVNQLLLENEKLFEAEPHSSSTTLRIGNSTTKYTPIHDYEELNEHDRRIQVQIAQGICPVNGEDSKIPYQPMAHQGVRTSRSPSGANPIQGGLDSNRQFPRERQNPMYSGVRAVSPFSNATEEPSVKEKPAAISEKCACAMVTMLIFAIIISVLSVTIVVLFATGVIASSDSSDDGIPTQIKQIQNELNILEVKLQAQREETQKKLAMYSNTMESLSNRIDQVAANKSAVRISEIQSQLTEAIQSLNPDEVQTIFGSLSGSALSRCKHEDGSIGSSTNQDKTESGEYYAEQGYVITGATCSSSLPSYVGSLQTREESDGENSRVVYKCDCLKIARSNVLPGERVECKIDFWQCPVSLG